MNNRNHPFFIVDVFGEQKYSGNQLAVFSEATNIDSDEMAAIAKETNFSETTFITSVDEEKGEIGVRIFTPGGEIPFAGHPTLGTAYVANKLFFDNSLETIALNLSVGKIPVKKEGDLLWMDQVQPQFGELFEKELMARLLGLSSADFLPEYPIESVSTGLPFYIAPVKSIEVLKRIKFDLNLSVKEFSARETKEVLVFCPEAYNSDDQLACRVFVPLLGIPEDPATGSANGCLAAYLLKYNVLNSEEINVSVAQGYEIKRPSKIHLRASVNQDVYTIRVGGRVIDIAEGSWY